MWIGQSSSFRLEGLLLGFFARRQIEFFEDDLWVNQTCYRTLFPVIQIDSMCQVAGVCRGSARNENSESLQFDWQRRTVSHCNSIPLLEILLCRSWNSSVLASAAIGK